MREVRRFARRHREARLAVHGEIPVHWEENPGTSVHIVDTATKNPGTARRPCARFAKQKHPAQGRRTARPSNAVEDMR